MSSDLKISSIEESCDEYFMREMSIDGSDECIKIWQKFICDVGCVVWDSAILLAKYLDHNRNELSLNKSKVVELGSGTGFCGIFCACLGSDVIITDLDYCLNLMLKNVNQNKSLINNRVVVRQYDWSQTGVEESDHFFNWNINQINYVLVSDCVYYEKSIEHLYKTIVWLTSKGAVVLLSYEDREDKEVLINQFFSVSHKPIEKYLLQSLVSVSQQLISNDSRLESSSVSKNCLHPDYNSPDLHLIQIINKT